MHPADFPPPFPPSVQSSYEKRQGRAQKSPAKSALRCVLTDVNSARLGGWMNVLFSTSEANARLHIQDIIQHALCQARLITSLSSQPSKSILHFLVEPLSPEVFQIVLMDIWCSCKTANCSHIQSLHHPSLPSGSRPKWMCRCVL